MISGVASAPRQRMSVSEISNQFALHLQRLNDRYQTHSGIKTMWNMSLDIHPEAMPV